MEAQAENASAPQETDDLPEQSMVTPQENSSRTHSAEHLGGVRGMTLLVFQRKSEASLKTYFPKKLRWKRSAKMQDSLENRLPADY